MSLTEMLKKNSPTKQNKSFENQNKSFENQNKGKTQHLTEPPIFLKEMLMVIH